MNHGHSYRKKAYVRGGPIEQLFTVVVSVRGEAHTRMPVNLMVTLRCDRATRKALMEVIQRSGIVESRRHRIIRCTTTTPQMNGRIIEQRARTAKLYQEAVVRLTHAYKGAPPVLNVAIDLV
jgi:hypothetical protein